MSGWWETTISDNPILRYGAVPKRLRRLSGRAQVAVLGGATVLCFLAAVYAAVTIREAVEAIGQIILWIWALLTVLVSGLQVAGSIVSERDRKTWDALILTRLRPAEIVLGKLFGVLLPLWTMGAVVLPGLMVLTSFRGDLGQWRTEWWYVLVVFGSTLVVSASFCSLAIYCSMCCRSVLVAQLMLFGIGFGAHVAAATITGLLGWALFSGLGWAAAKLTAWLVGGSYCLLLLSPGFIAGGFAIGRFRQLDRFGRV